MLKQSGAAITMMTAIIIPSILAGIIIITNVNSVILKKHQLKNSTELAALAGAAQLDTLDANAIINSTTNILHANTTTTNSTNITLGTWANSQFTATTTNPNAVQVIASENLSLINEDEASVITATSVAVKKPLIIGSYIVN